MLVRALTHAIFATALGFKARPCKFTSKHASPAIMSINNYTHCRAAKHIRLYLGSTIILHKDA